MSVVKTASRESKEGQPRFVIEKETKTPSQSASRANAVKIIVEYEDAVPTDESGLKKGEVRIVGVIIYIDYSRSRSEKLQVLTVRDNYQKNHFLHMYGFCQAGIGDSLVAVCKKLSKEGTNHLKITQPPFIQVALDQASVVECLVRSLKGTPYPISKSTAVTLYKAIKNSCEKDVMSELTHLASQWSDYRSKAALEQFTMILKEDQAKTLLVWWHRKRDLRQLWLLGLTNTEIKSCYMTAHEIYEQCIINPYVLYNLSMDKCVEILKRQNKIVSKPAIICGRIVRTIYDNLTDMKWMCMSERALKNIHRELPEVKDQLLTKYRVRYDLESYYLEYPHRVEMEVAKFLTERLTVKQKKESKNSEPEVTEAFFVSDLKPSSD